MNTAIVANKEIEITSFNFRNDPSKQRFESFPRRMVYEGREYTFMESGMHYIVKKGQDFIRLFDVSDEDTMYRLRVDGQNHWTLVTMQTRA
jgi:hypothetical protein